MSGIDVFAQKRRNCSLNLECIARTRGRRRQTLLPTRREAIRPASAGYPVTIAIHPFCGWIHCNGTYFMVIMPGINRLDPMPIKRYWDAE